MLHANPLNEVYASMLLHDVYLQLHGDINFNSSHLKKLALKKKILKDLFML